MSEVSHPEKLGTHEAPRLQQRRLWPAIRLFAVLSVVVLSVLLLARFYPVLLWAYNLERGGQFAETGLGWPEPPAVDSLPTSRDVGALDAALSHYGAAIRWRPDHPFAYRRAGEVYMARREWLKAVDAFERAEAVAPGNPLPAWESALAYEQMWRTVETAPKASLMPDPTAARVDAPDQRIETPFCREGYSHSCYAGRTTWRQSYTHMQDGPEVEADVLFLHPPASVRRSQAIDAEHAAFHFLIGLAPEARGWDSDGATFEVWVEPAGGLGVLVYERTVDGLTAQEGWIAGWADLTRWAGQTVTLVLRTTGGPANNTIADWYGWGNITLTTAEAAQYATLLPEVRMRQRWRTMDITAARLLQLGQDAAEAERYEAALRWYKRAMALEPTSSDPWYYAGLAYEGMGAQDNAVHAYVQATHRAPDDRDIWYALGRLYEERQEWDAALQAFGHGASASKGQVGASNIYFHIGRIRQFDLAPPDLDGALYAYRRALELDQFSSASSMKAASHYQLGTILTTQNRVEEAIAEFKQALALDRRAARFHLALASALWQVGQREAAQASARRATEVDPSDENAYRLLGEFYSAEGNVEEARAMFTKALELDPRDGKARRALRLLQDRSSSP